MYNASWASCASCARRNAEYVPRAFRRGGRGLLGKVREGVREGLSTDPWRGPDLPRPPGPCPCECCHSGSRVPGIDRMCHFAVARKPTELSAARTRLQSAFGSPPSAARLLRR
jgi:hypothetical protein